jgi:long-chain acyl-CoA synthetase
VLQDAAMCEEQEIFAYCKERLAEFKVPKIVEFRDEIPKSPLGKILRKALV